MYKYNVCVWVCLCMCLGGCVWVGLPDYKYKEGKLTAAASL